MDGSVSHPKEKHGRKNRFGEEGREFRLKHVESEVPLKHLDMEKPGYVGPELRGKARAIEIRHKQYNEGRGVCVFLVGGSLCSNIHNIKFTINRLFTASTSWLCE